MSKKKLVKYDKIIPPNQGQGDEPSTSAPQKSSDYESLQSQPCFKNNLRITVSRVIRRLLVMDFPSNGPFEISKSAIFFSKESGPQKESAGYLRNKLRALMGSFLDPLYLPYPTRAVTTNRNRDSRCGQTLLCGLIHHNHHLTHLSQVGSKTWRFSVSSFLTTIKWPGCQNRPCCKPTNMDLAGNKGYYGYGCSDISQRWHRYVLLPILGS